MKKILYLHGFASSGASGTVELLRKWFWERAEPAHRAVVVAPDIPLDPLVAEKTLEALAYDEMPDLVIGTSMGGMYAQMLHGFPRICVNPSFWTSKKYDILYPIMYRAYTLVFRMKIKFQFYYMYIILVIHTEITAIDGSLGNFIEFYLQFVIRQPTSVKLQ